MKIVAEFTSYEEMKEFIDRMYVVAPSETVITPQAISPSTLATVPELPPEPLPEPQPVQPAGPVAPTQPQTQVAVTESQYSMDDLATGAMALMDAGRQEELQALLSQFGVETLPQLPPEHYGTFATALRSLGGAI